ncbi:hypothetical protein [Paenibacillus humicus]|uniref:hypothetical protein n=1 Tax=Paenibacillus humicus TaxID=412861 RepID=UPI003F137790
MIKAIVVVIFLSLTACNASNPSFIAEEEFKPGVLLSEDLSFYEPEAKLKVGLGMTREQIENKLGTPIDFIDFSGINEYRGITIIPPFLICLKSLQMDSLLEAL